MMYICFRLCVFRSFFFQFFIIIIFNFNFFVYCEGAGGVGCPIMEIFGIIASVAAKYYFYI